MWCPMYRHAVRTWSAVCSEVPHSQFGEGARPMNYAATDEPFCKKIKTSYSKDYFLIGQSADHISGNKLSLLGQIL